MYQQSVPPRRSMWDVTKNWILGDWENPPAMLLWLLLTGATVGLLKIVGL